MLCHLCGEWGGACRGCRSATGAICAGTCGPAAGHAGSGHDRRLALSLSGRPLDSAYVLLSRRAGHSYRDWTLPADWRSSPAAVVVLLQHGCGISAAGNAGNQPAGAFLWHDLAGKWDRYLGLADRTVDRELDGRATCKTAFTDVDLGSSDSWSRVRVLVSI